MTPVGYLLFNEYELPHKAIFSFKEIKNRVVRATPAFLSLKEKRFMLQVK